MKKNSYATSCARSLTLILVCLCLAIPSLSPAVKIRVASWNVLFGVNDPGTPENNAVRLIMQRVQPDVCAFIELTNDDYTNWVALAAEFNYPYLSYGSSAGPLTGSQRVGFLSKFPITASYEITEYPGATELSRYPLHIVVNVPGALNPFNAWVVHNKAMSGTENEFRRAVEIRREISNIVSFVSSYPLDTEYAIMGDYNDDSSETQTAQFNSLPSGLPSAYSLGSDVDYPVPYKVYPTDRSGSIGMSEMQIYQEDTANKDTYMTGVRFDYMYLSPDIMNNPAGVPQGEVYNSAQDDGVGGLPKYGSPPGSATSTNASDHYMIFADVNLIDLLPCYMAAPLLSEIVDHPTNANLNFVEIYNSGVSSASMSNYAVVVYVNGDTPVSIPLRGSIPSGGTYLIAANSNQFVSTYGVHPNQASTNLITIDGNDVVALRNPASSIIDIYGIVGDPTNASDYSMDWAYRSNIVHRKVGVCDPSSTFYTNEWVILKGATNATPGTHVACDEAGVYYVGPQKRPAILQTNQDVQFSIEIHPNLPASNLAATAYYKVDGLAWQNVTMTNSLVSNMWYTASIFPGANAGDVLYYYVSIAFDGPGSASPAVTATNSYAFPSLPVEHSTTPLFNEVRYDDTGTDDIEFMELIAPAGTNLLGYFIIHYNGADTLDTDLWRFDFPSFTVPNDGVKDINATPLGFVVLAQSNSGVANADFYLPDTMQQGPDGLVLYDAQSNIVDAIAWVGAGDLTVDDPGTVSTNVSSSAPNYLHVLPSHSSSDNSQQAPNNVWSNIGGAEWSYDVATPGAINIDQTSSNIIITASEWLFDNDGDGLMNPEDNCKDVVNPIQSDLDGDGFGDACDNDDDNDGVTDASDNCPYDSNASQSDIDSDGQGDACDEDMDGDGIVNDNDNCPETYNPTQQDTDNDGQGDACDPDIDGDGVTNGVDNCVTTYNPSQTDTDSDTLGDACDEDLDADGVLNFMDNCPTNYNPDQTDENSDGIGDACSTDTDGDGIPDFADNCPAVSNAAQSDVDKDGVGDACDSCNGTMVTNVPLMEAFENSSIPEGWTVKTNGDSSYKAAWLFNNPKFRANNTGATGNFAIVDSEYARHLNVDTDLRTPALNFSNALDVAVEFKTDFLWYSGNQSETVDVDVSMQGSSGPWSNIWRKNKASYSGPATVSLDISDRVAGQSNVMIRFHYYKARDERYWEVDDVKITCNVCDPNYDSDGDGYNDIQDNCPTTYNPTQLDTDNDGLGDVCDTDIDGDGVPNTWEVQNSLNPSNATDAIDDPDKDGLSNYQEYRADTDPKTNASLFEISSETITGTARNVKITFTSSTNRYYETVYNDRTLKVSTNWYKGSVVPFKGQTPTTTFTDTNFINASGVTTRYYRVKVIVP